MAEHVLETSRPAAELVGEGERGPPSPVSTVSKAVGGGAMASMLGESSPTGPSERQSEGGSDAHSRPPSPPEGDTSAATPAVGVSPAKLPALATRPT